MDLDIVLKMICCSTYSNLKPSECNGTLQWSPCTVSCQSVRQILLVLLVRRCRRARVFARQFEWQSRVLQTHYSRAGGRIEREASNSYVGIVGDTTNYALA